MKYDPPSDPADRREYDDQWDRNKATDDHEDRKYRPPSEEVDRKAYDQQWDREKAKDDYRK